MSETTLDLGSEQKHPDCDEEGALGAFEWLRDWAPPPSVSLDPPAWADLVPEGGQDWLRKRYDELSLTPGCTYPLAALGAIVRLWQPGNRARTRALLAGEMVSPSEAAVAWWESVPEADLPAICQLAIAHAAHLIDDCHAMGDHVPSALWIVEERENLEGVLMLLEHRRAAGVLRQILRGVDEVIEGPCRALLGGKPLGEREDLLWGVFVADPTAWWGEIVDAA